MPIEHAEKSLDLYGVGNAIVDVQVKVSEEEFAQFDFPRGSSVLTTTAAQEEILGTLSDRETELSSGGSAGNSTILLAQLGGTAVFSGRLADDPYGMHFVSELTEFGVPFASPVVSGARSGVSLILVTPDGERTMRTALGVAAEMAPSDVNEELIAQSRWLFVEGYAIPSPNQRKTVLYAIDIAKRTGCSVAVTLADSKIVSGYRAEFLDLLQKADLVFANSKEAAALSGAENDEMCMEFLKGLVANVVLTRGAKGALIRYGGEEFAVPAFPCKALDTTGAGDAFAGAFIYGISNGYSVRQAAIGASYLAMRVITQFGARLSKDAALEHWEHIRDAAKPSEDLQEIQGAGDYG